MDKLTDIEIFYIKEHPNLTEAEIDSLFPNRDKAEIKILLEHNRSHVTTAKIENADEFNAGNLMGKREGITIMTKGASELADARKTLRVTSNKTFAKDNADKVYSPRKK